MLLPKRILMISHACLLFFAVLGQPCVAQSPAAAVDQMIPVWKTITLGTYRSAIDLREALESEHCVAANPTNSVSYRLLAAIPCKLGNSANEIIGRPEFELSSTPTQIRLVLLSAKDLGFPAESQPSLREIYDRAESLGYSLCPPEAGPQLRLQYTSQKIGEFLDVAMRPIRDYAGELTIFAVGNGGAGLLLVGSSGNPSVRIPATVQFVFIHSQQSLSHAENESVDGINLAGSYVEWIASKTGWKTISVPITKRASREQMSGLYFGFREGVNGARPLAMYAKEEHVLYLAHEIDLNTLFGRSILLHELVHHLQTVNDVHFECQEAVEAQAYQLQSQWLHEHGIQDVSALMGFSQMELNSMGCF